MSALRFMANLMVNLKIASRIYFAFAAMIILLVANSAIGIYANDKSVGLLKSYASSADFAVEFIEIKNSMNAIIHELRYGMVSLSEEGKKSAIDNSDRLGTRIANILARTGHTPVKSQPDGTSPPQAPQPTGDVYIDGLVSLQTVFEEYLSSFKKVLEISKKREAAAERLWAQGPDLFNAIDALTRHAYDTQNRELLNETAGIGTALQKAQIEILRFMRTSLKKSSDEADGHLKTAGQMAGRVAAGLPDEAGGKLARAAESAVNQYKKTFLEVSATTFVAARLFGEVMDAQAKQIIDQADTLMRLQAEAKQKTIDLAMTESAHLQTLSLALAGVMVAMGVLLSGVIVRNVVGAVRRMTQTMTRLAQGHYDTPIPGLEARNEIGEMARSVDFFKQKAMEVEHLRVEQAEQAEHGREERRGARLAFADQFERAVKGIVETVADAAAQLQSYAVTLTSTAEKAGHQAETAATAAERSSGSIQTVVGATEALSSSIREISRQTSQSTTVARTASEQADKTNHTVKALQSTAQEIGAIVDLITGIASQTNLLALNATIEAARAGEAGRGFAVVAGEVKNLASQTASATEDIRRQIELIQNETSTAVSAIESISTTIGNINAISATIAAAVDEQDSTTKAITDNVQEVSHEAEEVIRSVGSVQSAIQETAVAARHVSQASGDLSQQAETLRRELDTFLEMMRAA